VLLATDDGPDLPGLRRFHVERYAIEGKNRTSVRYVRE
jgi:hypothetical protein